MYDCHSYLYALLYMLYAYLPQDYLTIGPDNHYFKDRDYMYNADDNFIEKGSFSIVASAEDLASNHLFAIKYNSVDDKTITESIETEARMLARLGPHANVIQMYGAVIDYQESELHPTRIYKLMMELAERK